MRDEALRAAVEIFAELPDPRVNRGLNHALVNIVTIALCAVLSEAESFADIQAFGEEKRGWLEGFLDLPYGIPDHETFRRVFARLDPTHFQSSALDWIRHLLSQGSNSGDTLSIDGKRLRGTSSDELQGVHMLNVWSARHGLCLAATAVDGKSNEIT